MIETRCKDGDDIIITKGRKEKGDLMLRVGGDKIINLRIFAEKIEKVYDKLMEEKDEK